MKYSLRSHEIAHCVRNEISDDMKFASGKWLPALRKTKCPIGRGSHWLPLLFSFTNSPAPARRKPNQKQFSTFNFPFDK